MRWPCSSCVPCEKLSRATSIPRFDEAANTFTVVDGRTNGANDFSAAGDHLGASDSSVGWSLAEAQAVDEHATAETTVALEHDAEGHRPDGTILASGLSARPW
jgi:hypothetical protein